MRCMKKHSEQHYSGSSFYGSYYGLPHVHAIALGDIRGVLTATICVSRETLFGFVLVFSGLSDSLLV